MKMRVETLNLLSKIYLRLEVMASELYNAADAAFEQIVHKIYFMNKWKTYT